MLSDVPLDVANFFGFTCAVLLYGAYFSIFGVTIQLLRKRKRRSWVVLGTMLGLFLTTTTTLVLCVIDNYDAWIRAREHEGVIAYFASTSSSIKVTKDLLLLLSALLADGLLCWRLFVIWSRSALVLVAPVLILLAEAAVGLLVVAFEYHESIAPDGRFRSLFDVGAVVLCICSAAVNILVTGLICGRLWWVGRRVSDMTDRDRYAKIIRVIVESGLLYTAAVFVFFITVVTKLQGVYRLMEYIVTVIVAIAPTLIVLHLNYAGVHNGLYERDPENGAPSSSIRFQTPSINEEDDVSIMQIHRSSPGYLNRNESPASQHGPYSTSTMSPLSPQHPHIQVTLSPASSSSFTVNRSPTSVKQAMPAGRLRTSSSHPSIPLGLGWSDVSLAPIGSTEGWLPHMDQTLRESWRAEADAEAEMVEIAPETLIDDPVRLSPVLPPLSRSSTGGRRPSTYFSAVSDTDRHSRVSGSVHDPEGPEIEMNRLA